jgi:hypothetical protein
MAARLADNLAAIRNLYHLRISSVFSFMRILRSPAVIEPRCCRMPRPSGACKNLCPAACLQRAAPEAVVPVAPPVPVVPDGPTVVEPALPEVPPDGAPDMPAPLPEVESVVLPDAPPAEPPDMPLLPEVPLLPDMPPVAPAAPAEPAAPLVSAAPEEPVAPAAPVAPVPPAAPALALSEVVPAAVPALPLEPEPVVEPPDIAPPLEPVVPVDGDAVVLGVLLVVVDAPGEVVSAVRRSQPATTAVRAAVASMSLVSLDSDCIASSLNFRKGSLLRSPGNRGNASGHLGPDAVEPRGGNAVLRITLRRTQRTFRAKKDMNVVPGQTAIFS